MSVFFVLKSQHQFHYRIATNNLRVITHHVISLNCQQRHLGSSKPFYKRKSAVIRTATTFFSIHTQIIHGTYEVYVILSFRLHRSHRIQHIQILCFGSIFIGQYFHGNSYNTTHNHFINIYLLTFKEFLPVVNFQNPLVLKFLQISAFDRCVDANVPQYLFCSLIR